MKQRSKSSVVILMLSLLMPVLLWAAGAAKPEKEPTKAPAGDPGSTPATALNVCTPDGETAYLARLRCPDGRAPKFERSGSVGPRRDPQTKQEEDLMSKHAIEMAKVKPGEPDFHILDAFEVTCADGKHEVFLDMYHCGEPEPTVAPKGFTLVKK